MIGFNDSKPKDRLLLDKPRSCSEELIGSDKFDSCLELE